jgi:hypothetical protein
MNTVMITLPKISMPMVIGGAVAVMAWINLLQLVLLVRMKRRVVEVERVNERLDHFAQALTLLTDTTEQGLENVATGLQALGRKMTTRGGTKATARRIADAARGGRPLSAIAADEAMSESEVRLHVGLQQTPSIRLATSQGAVVFGRDKVREDDPWQAANTSH